MSDPARDLAELTLELIRIPSESRHEEALSAHVEQWMRPTHGAPRGRLGPTLVFGGRTAPDRRTLALIAHLDTVPDVPGLTPRIEDGQVHGRGASDLKSGMAVMMALAERFPPGRGAVDLMLVFYACEEIAIAENHLAPLLAACPWMAEEIDLAVCVEPTDNFVELGCNGTLHAEIVVPGRRSHSARPWLGDNAIHRGAELIARVAAVPERRVELGDLLYREVMSVTRVSGGGARNVIPGEMTFNVNFRFAPDRDLASAEAAVRDLFPDAASVTIVDAAPAGLVCADNELARALVSASGRPPRAKQGWTDVAQLSAAGIDAVNYGPGVPDRSHQDDESVPVANLEPSYRALASLLE